MAEIYQSGAGRVGETGLGDFGLLPLSQVLCAYPGTDWDKPLPYIEGFDNLADTKTADEIEALSRWIAPQTTCQYVLDYHGAEGLKRVLIGIARACVEKRVSMSDRVASFAAAHGLEVL